MSEKLRYQGDITISSGAKLRRWRRFADFYEYLAPFQAKIYILLSPFRQTAQP